MTVVGSIDRIDRLPSGGIEVIDHKTGRLWSQAGVEEKFQLSIHALACPCRDRPATPRSRGASRAKFPTDGRGWRRQERFENRVLTSVGLLL